MAQYFAYRDGESPHLDLSGLARIYANLGIVNRAMAKRLRNTSEQDAAVNATSASSMFWLRRCLMPSSVIWSVCANYFHRT